MDKEYIEREPLIHDLKDKLCIYPACVRRAIVNAPAADVVSRGLFEQIKWERDIAMTQLEEHGIAFGAKKTANVVKVEHAEWIYHINDLFPEDGTQECSRCHEEETIRIHNENYCPNCGAKMDDNREEERNA